MAFFDFRSDLFDITFCVCCQHTLFICHAAPHLVCKILATANTALRCMIFAEWITLHGMVGLHT